jgi:hypothetical protein
MTDMISDNHRDEIQEPKLVLVVGEPNLGIYLADGTAAEKRRTMAR